MNGCLAYMQLANISCLNILNHTSNAKSNRTFNITYIVSSIEKQFYQKLKHLFMKIIRFKS